MTGRDVVAVVNPPPAPGERGEPQRTLWLVDELAAAIATVRGAPVSIVEGRLADAAAAGVVLCFTAIRDDVLRDVPALASRTIWMDAGRFPADACRRFGLAGAVSTIRYLEWARRRGRDRAQHVWTRRELADRLGARIEIADDVDPTIVRVRDDRYANLAGLLAALCAIVIGEQPPPGDAAPA